MKTITKYEWKLKDALPGPCMICYKNTVTCHGTIAIEGDDLFEGRTPLRLLLCDDCARLEETEILEKLGFLTRGA